MSESQNLRHINKLKLKIMKTKTKVIGGIVVVLATAGITAGLVLKRKIRSLEAQAMDYVIGVKQELSLFDTDEEKINFLNEKLESFGGNTVLVDKKLTYFRTGSILEKLKNGFIRVLLIGELRDLGVDISFNIIDAGE